jgi:branched-chain amino acid transport system ATP-binding protein
VTSALKISKLSKSFGGLKAIEDFNLDLPVGSIHGVIGPNGAGKTTMFNLVTGVYRADSGQIWLGEKEITYMPADAIARAGMIRTFQNIRLFVNMSVWDNVKMAFHFHENVGFWQTLGHFGDFNNTEKKISRESLEFLERFGLAHRCGDLAGSLSYGEQRRLEMARVLATQARVLLLDEPAAGLNPKEVQDLVELIRKIHRDFSLSILLIEHQMPVIMELCEHVQVLNFGKQITEGGVDLVVQHPEVISAYLGSQV